MVAQILTNIQLVDFSKIGEFLKNFLIEVLEVGFLFLKKDLSSKKKETENEP